MPGQRRRPARHDPSAFARWTRAFAPRADGLAGSPFRVLAIVTIALLCSSPFAAIAGTWAIPTAAAAIRRRGH
jgi:hypothetical protein